MSDRSALDAVRERLKPYGARLVAVSKTKPPEAILDLYRRGQRDFGENRVQELLDKQAALPEDIRWHVIGHLQRNKVKQVVPFVHLIHSVDSPRLLREIDKRAGAIGRVVDCLLQFKIAAEDTKYGFDPDTARELLAAGAPARHPHVRLCGVMGMATFTEDEAQVRGEFRRLRGIFDELKASFFAEDDHFREISMGMSDDHPIALEEGSTMVRIGTLLFGPRDTA